MSGSPDEKTINIGDDEQAVDVVLEDSTTEKAEPSQERVQKAAPATSEDDDDGELENYSDNVKKRIGRMTFKVRETERREKAALDFARGLQKTLEEEQTRRRELDTAFVREYDNRLKLQETLIRARLREAIDRGDAEQQIEANKELSTISMEQERIRITKQRMGLDAQPRQQPAQQAAAPPVQREVEQPQQAQQPARVDPRAQDWAAKNKWFGADDAMTLTAFSIHKKLVEEEHFDPTGDDYYAELDKRIRREFPHKFQVESNSRPQQVVAGARPGNPNAGKRTTLRLTPSQVAIAKKLNVPLEEYAKQLQQLNK